MKALVFLAVAGIAPKGIVFGQELPTSPGPSNPVAENTAPDVKVDPAEYEDLKALMQTVATETMAGKVETLVSHSHPALIKMLGGEEKALEILPKLMRADFETVERMGFKMTSFDVGNLEAVRKRAEWTFALLPTTMVMEGPKGKFTAKSHTLAARRSGEAKWYLLRLGQPEAKVRALLPELPPDFTWPERQPPKFEAK